MRAQRDPWTARDWGWDGKDLYREPRYLDPVDLRKLREAGVSECARGSRQAEVGQSRRGPAVPLVDLDTTLWPH